MRSKLHANEGDGGVLAWMAILGGVVAWLLPAAVATIDRIPGPMTTDIRLNSPRRVDPHLAAFPEPTSAHAVWKV